MATYVGDLITEVRRDTDNTSFSSTSGISTEDFLRYMNFALMRLQAVLIQQNSTLFRKKIDIPLVAGQNSYSISDNVYLKESIINIMYSSDGQEANYRNLPEIGESYISYDTAEFIAAYARRGGTILTSSIPQDSQGKLRVTYDRALDRLDIRRGTIDGITVATSAITANTISIDVNSDDDTRISGVSDKYICVVNKDGVVGAYNIAYTAYNTGTGNFTHETKSVESGQTPAIGDYVTVGRYTTTHLSLLDSPSVERYLQLYAAHKIFKRDSSTDALEAKQELLDIEQELIEAYQQIQNDDQEIQISDRGIMLLFDGF